MKQLRRSAAALLAAFVLGGCEDDPAGPTAAAGTLTASYDGYFDGSLLANGAYENRPGTTYAIAFDIPDTPNGALHVGGEDYRQGEGRSLVMTLNDATVGEYSFSADCDFDNAQCAYGLFEYDDDVVDADAAEPFEVIGGTVTISEVTSERVRGTFELQTQRFNRETGAPKPGEFLTIRGGSFDVPMVTLTGA